MDLAAAENMARTLIAQHAPDYTFGWNNRKTQAGVCRFDTKRIELSRAVAAINEEAEVRDTVLHECAHAIADR